ncbi:MAG: pyrroloquinoline quinone biosynthesis peptide chaperone PqqD [Hyphomicrobiales bacterium]|nr:pyrroloquinoline quinone biosynthesis peptide chaperone PqqD [Hyphomicrobiales bacterium]
MTGALQATSRPRLPRGVRLKHDKVRGEWLLLAPERVIKTNGVARAVLERCTGELTLRDIIAGLVRDFEAPEARIEADVRALLMSLAEKRLLDF